MQNEPLVNVLLVEPDMLAQLATFDAVRAARARVDLACVSTCGGGRRALERGEFDALMLSTNLCYSREERSDLVELVRRATQLELAIIALGPTGFQVGAGVLGVPVHEALGQADVVRGELDAVLARAQARARFDGTLARLASCDRMALSGRAALGAVRKFEAVLGQARTSLRSLERESGIAATSAILAVLDELGVAASETRCIARLVQVDETEKSGLLGVQVEAVLDDAVTLALAITGGEGAVVRNYGPSMPIVFDQAVLCQVFTNLLLAVQVQAGTSGVNLSLSVEMVESALSVEVRNAAVSVARDRLSGLFEPLRGVGEQGDCLGLWLCRQLLLRWGASVEAESGAGLGLTFRVRFPVPACFYGPVAA